MNDWVEWNGGDMPVPYGTLVDVEYRDGAVAYGLKAGDWSSKCEVYPGWKRVAAEWELTGGPGGIVRYRLHKPHSDTAARLEAARREWEPEGGQYWVAGDGEVRETQGLDIPFARFGVERPTRQLAEQARDAMRSHNRALAYVHEHAPGWDGSDPCGVLLHESLGYRVVETFWFPVGTVTGPRHVMQQLADDLNSGRVKL